MNDPYVEEIRKIRQKQYEETQEMTTEEQIAYTQVRAERFEQRVAKHRAKMLAEANSKIENKTSQ